MTRTVAVLLLLIAGLCFAGLGYGDYPVLPGALLSALAGQAGTAPDVGMIVFDLRMPRVLLSLLVGLALAVAGAISQAVMRNPLAEPGILGINAGAAFAAMIVLVALKDAPVALLPWAGFAGASLMAAAIYGLSWRNGTTTLRLILIGIGLSALAGAVNTFLSAFGAVGDVQRAMIWLAGSTYHADWAGVRTLALWLVLPVLVTLMLSRELDLIRFGDQTARGRGQSVNLTRAVLIALCTLISGAAVAAAGLIGFVGLIAPHMARHLVGPTHRRLIPVAALVGAAIVLGADFAGRVVIAPGEIPAGLVTALLGAPFFGLLLWRFRDVPS